MTDTASDERLLVEVVAPMYANPITCQPPRYRNSEVRAMTDAQLLALPNLGEIKLRRIRKETDRIDGDVGL